ncbi:growth/differentiation factor 10 [Pangasianodon hypophthalmus]|uniref:growth/differentiation factor 10 n=1 Tax=Pangasianodon hypophthalmus TaxID=310915 RepID=UPI000EFFD389|nr:growth/differentiation factor 10 [Pangasianodon hypophthalmus]
MAFKCTVLAHLLLFSIICVLTHGVSDFVLDVAPDEVSDSMETDRVSQHMFKLYEKYTREPHWPKNTNTVRSFKAKPESLEQRDLYHLNLTLLQDSEVVLTSTLHFFFDKRPRQRSWFCKRLRSPSCRLQNQHYLPSFHLLFRSCSSDSLLGSLLGNITFYPHSRGIWQTKDVSQIIKEARLRKQAMITLEFDYGKKYQRHQERLSAFSLPYMLVHANDQAISEPNSVAMSLQRYDPFPADEKTTQSSNTSPDMRVKRDLYFPDPIQNNELPEVEYNSFTEHDKWESTYLALKPKPSKKEQRKKDHGSVDGTNKLEVLSFDEKTMKKARRRQWREPRVCSRRYLKVDFADIGWSEWILSPKSFDAYYCAGTCEFPIPKVVRPSNHATIQSIVKTVGIIPGIPEPCCVPEKMNPLSVLFLDEAKNIILKNYPDMSVETCSCR